MERKEGGREEERYNFSNLGVHNQIRDTHT